MPAASTAAATVLAEVFPADRDWLLVQGREAAEARVWAGIHYRSDIDAGELVGEMSALDGRPRSASVVALEEGALIAFLPAKPFQTLVTAHPELAMAMMLRLCDKLRGATDRIMELSTLGANNRVHAELLRLARRASRQGASAVITPIPVHSDIAARVSTTRETVARVLSDLTRDGMLERRSNALVVRDLPRLELLVEDVRGGA